MSASNVVKAIMFCQELALLLMLNARYLTTKTQDVLNAIKDIRLLR